MPSYELEPFSPNRNIRIVGATEILLPWSLRVLFWMNDPEQQVVWPESADNLASCLDTALDTASSIQADVLGYPRRDYLWQHTCFELFIGLKNQPNYREVNLSPAGTWNCYGFDSYRQPADMPPVAVHDIQLLELKAQAQKLEAVLSFQQFFEAQQCGWSDMRIGISSVIKTRQQHALYFALQHSGPQPDFHRQQDWIGSF